MATQTTEGKARLQDPRIRDHFPNPRLAVAAALAPPSPPRSATAMAADNGTATVLFDDKGEEMEANGAPGTEEVSLEAVHTDAGDKHGSGPVSAEKEVPVDEEDAGAKNGSGSVSSEEAEGEAGAKNGSGPASSSAGTKPPSSPKNTPDPPPPPPPRRKLKWWSRPSRSTITIASFALLGSFALWFFADHPRCVVWIFSLVAISCLTACAIVLTTTMRAHILLAAVSYIAFAALSVIHVSAAAGIFVMLIDTAYAAWLFGYALSEHRQRNGTELSAEAVPEPSSRTREELKEDNEVMIKVIFYAMVASLVCLIVAIWVVCYTVEIYWLVVGLSLLIDLILFSWTCLVAVHLLRGAFITDSHLTVIYWLVVVLFLPDYLISRVFGESIGMLVHPLGVIGMAGLLGYSVGVYTRYVVIRKGKGRA
ncbi:hypothetical protein ACP70R_009093 [Stipagrostis hirtigluma subsp. patula]